MKDLILLLVIASMFVIPLLILATGQEKPRCDNKIERVK